MKVQRSLHILIISYKPEFVPVLLKNLTRIPKEATVFIASHLEILGKEKLSVHVIKVDKELPIGTKRNILLEVSSNYHKKYENESEK